MRDMVLQLQDQMAAQQATIDTQQEVIQEAGLEDDSKSYLSSFIESTEFSGWVTASYTWNTHYKGGKGGLAGQNVGVSGLSDPFHPDSNSFQVDQLWFSMDKDVSDESRGGFHADILLGKTATLLGDNPSFTFGNSGLALYTAYASYLAPIGDGLRIDMGELPTLIGAEVVQAPANFNITRGLVWSMQPITNTGILLSSDVGPVSLAVGALNNFRTDSNTDTNNNKAVTASVGMGNDTFSGSLNMVYGSGTQVNSDRRGGILDMVLSADPTDNLSIWYNFDYYFTNDDLPRSNSFGNALAARLGVTDDFGVAIRGEYLILNDSFSRAYGVRPNGKGGDVDLWSVTGTLDYTLAEGLLSRFEVRYDDADRDNMFFNAGGTANQEHEIVLLLDLTYMF